MPDNDENVGVAMALVIGAGAATGIGGSVVFFPSLVRLASRKTLAGALGLSAGVMTYVSFAEIFLKAEQAFRDADFSEEASKLYATLCFFAGVVAMVLLNQIVTYLLGGHHHHHGGGAHAQQSSRVKTTGEESREEDLDDEDDEDDDGIAPCPCHDDNPIETLSKVQNMAESMAAHPNRPHPGGYHHNQVHGITDSQTGAGTTSRADETSEGPDSINPRSVPGSISAQSGNIEALSLEPKASSAPPDSSGHGTNSELYADEEDKAEEDEEVSSDEDEEGEDEEDDEDEQERNRSLMRMSLNTALAIGLHNFPEGLATFVAALDDPAVGAVLAVAIAIHNIPEGLCVAMPIYYATGNKWQAFGWALLSGIAEPIAGLLGWLILAQSFSNQLYALLFGMVSGMMVVITIRELLPTAHRYDPEDSLVTYSFIGGMGIMALSLMLFLL